MVFRSIFALIITRSVLLTRDTCFNKLNIMKLRLFFSVFMFTLFFSNAFSQKVSVGIKAGTDLHKIMGKSFDEQFTFGYHAGAFVELKVKKIGIQPEIYFSQVNTKKGKTATDINPTASDLGKVKLSYLNIPIMLNLYFNSHVAFEVGPQFAALVSQNVDGQTNVQNAFKKGDFSLAGGLQIKFLKFRFYGRYVIGLNDKNYIKDVNDNTKWKSQTVHLGVGYSFL